MQSVDSGEARAREAFLWIVELLENAGIRYQVTGGLAARVYGATRPIVDLDFDVPEQHLRDVAALASQYLVFGPEQHRDEHWDLLLVTLDYKGQKIDLGGANEAKICDHVTGEWSTQNCRLDHSETRELFGRLVPVIPRKLLIEYKWKLGRDVDQLDITALGHTGSGRRPGHR